MKAPAKTAAMANAGKVAVTVAVVAAVVNAAKGPKARSALRVKAVAVVKDVLKAELKAELKAATSCVRAKPARHALSVANAPSVLPVTALLAKAVAMAVVTTATKDAAKLSPS